MQVLAVIVILIRANSNFRIFPWTKSLASPPPTRQSDFHRDTVFCLKVSQGCWALFLPSCLPRWCSLPGSPGWWDLPVARGSALACCILTTPGPGETAKCTCSWGRMWSPTPAGPQPLCLPEKECTCRVSSSSWTSSSLLEYISLTFSSLITAWKQLWKTRENCPPGW